MDVRLEGNVLSTFWESSDGISCEARLYYKQADGSWQPPLPLGLEIPPERSRSSSSRRTTIERIGGETSFGWAGTTARVPAKTRTTSARPSWQLREPEPWRLRR